MHGITFAAGAAPQTPLWRAHIAPTAPPLSGEGEVYSFVDKVTLVDRGPVFAVLADFHNRVFAVLASSDFLCVLFLCCALFVSVGNLCTLATRKALHGRMLQAYIRVSWCYMLAGCVAGHVSLRVKCSPQSTILLERNIFYTKWQ